MILGSDLTTYIDSIGLDKRNNYCFILIEARCRWEKKQEKNSMLLAARKK